jgi:hypothetical protein
MRLAYSQGLEVLFSLLFASIQAPNCVVGWLLNYKNVDLTNVMKKFRDYHEILHSFTVTIRGWDALVELLFSEFDKEQKESVMPRIKGFAQLWEQFAQDFLDSKFSDEYNSLKHGLRVHMGGFHLMEGIYPNNGVPSGIEEMETLAYSKFGSTFFVSERIERTPNFVIHTQSRNWDPENYYHALKLISLSLKNILAFLKKVNGNKEPQEYLIPNDEEFFRKPWLVGSKMSLGCKSRVPTQKIPLLSKEDILSIYKK